MLRFITYNIHFGGVDDDGTNVVSRQPLIHAGMQLAAGRAA